MFAKCWFQNVCQGVFDVGFIVFQSRLQLEVELKMVFWSRCREFGKLVSSFGLATLKLYVLEQMTYLLNSNLPPW